VDLEEERQGDALFEGEDGGVEALQVAHLEDAPGARGGGDQAVGGGKVTGDGLFHQQVNASVEKVAAEIGVDGGGRGDDGGVDLAGEVASVGEGGGLVAGGGFMGAGGVDSWTTRQWFWPKAPAPITATLGCGIRGSDQSRDR
jgi:hypothetical protein